MFRYLCIHSNVFLVCGKRKGNYLWIAAKFLQCKGFELFIISFSLRCRSGNNFRKQNFVSPIVWLQFLQHCSYFYAEKIENCELKKYKGRAECSPATRRSFTRDKPTSRRGTPHSCLTVSSPDAVLRGRQQSPCKPGLQLTPHHYTEDNTFLHLQLYYFTISLPLYFEYPVSYSRRTRGGKTS